MNLLSPLKHGTNLSCFCWTKAMSSSSLTRFLGTCVNLTCNCCLLCLISPWADLQAVGEMSAFLLVPCLHFPGSVCLLPAHLSACQLLVLHGLVLTSNAQTQFLLERKGRQGTRSERLLRKLKEMSLALRDGPRKGRNTFAQCRRYN